MNSPVLQKSWEGQVVEGKFPLRRWLGSSDHSTVFLTELASGQKAAIKLIPATTLNVDQLARWRPALKLSHPHLLRVFDTGRCEIESVRLLYLVMEYAEEDLSQVLPQRALSTAEVGELLSPTLDALSFLHAKGFVHSAVKPSNIHAANDRLKLSVDRLCMNGQLSDKVHARTVYDAPELATGAIVPEADLWSLGVTTVEALTQRPPAPLGTREPIVPETLPEPFRGIARACLRRDPKQRPSILDVKARLRSSPVPATAEPQRVQPKPPKWHVLVPITGALILVALLAPAIFHRTRPATSDTKFERTDAPPKSPPATSPKPPAEPAKVTSSAGEAVRQVLPDVPKSARNTIQGKIRVVVRVDVDSSGKVIDAKLTSPGPSQYFARLALQAAQRWEFSAPQVNGQPVPSGWVLRFRFGRAGTEVAPARVNQ